MAKVVRKALDILTLLGNSPDREIFLTEISECLHGHPATIANILKVMVDSGYVEQKRPRAGYTLGPMIYRLTRHGPYRKDLVALAEPEVVSLSKKTGETVLLATLSRGRKSILCVAEGTNDVQIRPNLILRHDIYLTATGRLLLAYRPPSEMHLCVARNGFPGKDWDGIENYEELSEALKQIREQGFAIKTDKPTVVAYALPVFEGEEVAATIGVAVPAFRRVKNFDETILGQMKKTSASITEILESWALEQV